MPRTRSPEPPKPDAELRVPREVAAEKIKARIDSGEELCHRDIQSPTDTLRAWDDCRRWDRHNIEFLEQLFTAPKFAEEYSRRDLASVGSGLPGMRLYAGERIDRLQSILDRLDLIPVVSGVASAAVGHAPRPHSKKVFVVHGHDEAARESIARFLERLGVEAVILHEQATAGRTIVEKLEHYADVDFAVVIMTADDLGGSKASRPTEFQPRARQNVVLELGYFLGKLGRPHVCALYRGALELPSDVLGVVYVPLDSGGGWRLQLAKELRSAGFSVDVNLAL